MSTSVSDPFRMKAKAEGEGGSYTPPPAGSHPACLVAIVDLGTHTDVYNGDAKTTRQVYLVWELVGEARPEDGQNHLIGARYTLSSHPKAGLRLMLEGWRGKGFGDDEDIDLPGWLGRNCLANVTHEESGSGKTYAKLKAISPLPKMMEKACPKPTYPLVCWNFASDDERPDVSHLPYVFGTPVKDKIEASQEWKKAHGGGTQADSESPF